MEPPPQYRSSFKDKEPNNLSNDSNFFQDRVTRRHQVHHDHTPAYSQPNNTQNFDPHGATSTNLYPPVPPPQQPSSPVVPPAAATAAFNNRPAFRPQQQQQQFPPQHQSFYDPNQFVSEPVVSLAKAYGGQLAEQSKQQIEKYVSVNQLKYYFDVDNTYVGKKLGLLLFPFVHKDWSVKCNNEQEPLPPRYDVNAPDLYLPVMAIVTYILVAGLVLGIQDRFSPEQLGVYASSALMWFICENLIVLIAKYILNISQSLRVWDTLAFCGYKYVCMNICLFAFLCLDKTPYYSVLAYCSLSTVVFLIRSVKGFVLENFSGTDGRKRKLYLLLIISLSQPFIIWWLTSSLTSYSYKLSAVMGDEMMMGESLLNVRKKNVNMQQQPKFDELPDYPEV